MKIEKLLPLLFLLNISCNRLEYKEDNNFMMPVEGGSLESLVYIKNIPCKDLYGNIGACTLSHDAVDNIILNIPPNDYDYALDFVCSSNINFTKNYDVLKRTPFQITIPLENFKDEKSFMCVGEIFPGDRTVVSHKFEIRVRVVNARYMKRNIITVSKKKGGVELVLGQFAKHIRVFNNGNIEFLSKKTTLKINKKDLETIKVITESESGRFNYFNI